jgi:hypothetical protein
MASVTREAQDAARLRSYLLMSDPDPNKLSTSAQEMVAKLHQTQGRDLEVVDPSQLGLAAAISSHIGKRFTGSPDDEVGATIKDRQVRTFPAVSQEYPTGIKQIGAIMDKSGRRFVVRLGSGQRASY